MLDEPHERTIYTDILFGFLLKKLIKRRNDLRLTVTSATLDADKLSFFFSFLTATFSLITVLQIHLTEPEGDIPLCS
jgi:ATP-dependent RNA helicase DHX8/PRP22